MDEIKIRGLAKEVLILIVLFVAALLLSALWVQLNIYRPAGLIAAFYFVFPQVFILLLMLRLVWWAIEKLHK